ncbi:hypothetical protein SteCoe_20384 [Stentor coeruleus]|uniref:ubiquitinyl hydrolase 1 n=1 Tax=Stentor coeruleus TaxID=5963 RepID=A0A1R2BS52_9CILI|nr:hypothetical protein SteCoe_20384 [Stentor coeruleus]
MVHQSKEVIKTLVEMGFDEITVIKALDECNGNQERALDYLLNKDTNTSVVPYAQNPSIGLKVDEDEIKKAIALSMEESSKSQSSEQKERDPNTPIGLKNSSNVSFFTSLIQFYYSLPFFREIMMKQVPSFQPQDNRGKKLVKLISEMSLLFKNMGTNKMKYEDTNRVMNALIDIDGSQVINSEKNDIGEFSMRFIAKIEEGLSYLNSQGEENVAKRKDSMSFLIDNSILSKFFCGKLVNDIRSKLPDGSKYKDEQIPTIFGKFEIEVDKKEFYEAWGDALTKEIDNFQVADGVFVKAKQTSWIDGLPGVLIFGINRLATDSNGNLFKIKKGFSFPMYLYPGRYLLGNQKKTRSLQKALATKKRNAKQLENSIETFDNFEGKNVNISKMLNLCLNFLENQKNQDINIDENEVFVEPPFGIEKQSSFNETLNVIKAYSDKVRSNLEEMKEKLRRYEDEIENTFDEKKFRKQEYELSAIVIHDGDAGSGQYYSYMKKDGVWRKYHDINVTEVGEKNVMFDSLGEYGISAACCLIYVDKGLLRDNN